MRKMRRVAPVPLLPLLVLVVLLPTCGGKDGTVQTADLGNRFQATAERPYSFDYPSGWTLGEETEGELVLGIEGSVGMVLEPVHPWGGMGGFRGPDVEPVEIDGHEAYRMALNDDEGDGQGVAYRVNLGGTDATVWFFANDSAAYDEVLFEAIMSTFRLEEGLLEG